MLRVDWNVSVVARSLAVAGVASLLVAGCGGGGGGGAAAQGGGAVVYLNDAQAAPVAEPDGDPVMSMTELSLSVKGVQLVAAGGKRHAIAVGGRPARIARLSGALSSEVLATGAFPEGSFEAVEIVLADATVRGVPAAGGPAVDRTLALPPQGVVRAAFAAPVTLSAGCQLSIEWPASVTANDGASVLTLGQGAQAFLVGGAGVSGKPTIGVRKVKGDLTVHDLGKEELTLVVGLSTLTVETTAGTTFLEQDGLAIANGFADLDVGDELQVAGTLEGAGRITATQVRVLHRSKKGHVALNHHGAGHFEIEGVARGVAASGATGVDLRIFVGKTELARVTVDVSSGAPNGGTTLQHESGAALSRADFMAQAEGRRVQIYASLVVQNPGSVAEARRTDLVILEP